MNKDNKIILLVALGLLAIIILGFINFFCLKPRISVPQVFCLDTADLTSEERSLWVQEAESLERLIQIKEIDKPSLCSIDQILIGQCLEQETSALSIRLGVIYSTLAEPEKSLTYYYSALADWDQDPEFWKLIANEEMTLCRFYQAEDSLTRALDIAQDDIECWQGLIFIEKKKFNSTRQDVRRLYREALAATDHNLELMIDWAEWLSLQGDQEELARVWQEMIELYPEQEDMINSEIREGNE